MFAGEIIGVESKNELYGIMFSVRLLFVKSRLAHKSSDHTMRFSPGSPIGVMHDW